MSLFSVRRRRNFRNSRCIFAVLIDTGTLSSNMCLTIPKQIISINKGVVKLKSGNNEENASSIINVKKGDWVLTQKIVRHGSLQNVIIKKINKKQAAEILHIIKNHKQIYG